MKHPKRIFAGLTAAFVLLMSLPWIVPHTGWAALVGFVPLLIMERLADAARTRHFWWWHYAAFVLWNAATTWWVGGATVGGAVFAVLANALQMSAVFGSFRWVKRRTSGSLPYLYLAAAWIAWEKYYLTVAQISWPWLVLGNAFAENTSLVQWYSVLGSLGGSLWVWTANLSLFGLLVALSDGRMNAWNGKARAAASVATVLAFFGPMLWSACLSFEEKGSPLKVVLAQPNFDPYQKFRSVPRSVQDETCLSLLGEADWRSGAPVLALAPETFVQRLYTDDLDGHESVRRFRHFLRQHPQATFIFGAATLDRVYGPSAPDPCAYDMGTVENGRQLWLLAHNSAVSADSSGCTGLYHKSKLVVGTELTPYPRFFIPFQRWLLGQSVMGQDVGQPEISCLPLRLQDGTVPVGVPVCYESVYGEFCAGYVRKGARLLAVITNDAWWGDTPGYRQHLSYSRLRAIETRRWVARCANTGISAVIDPRGNIRQRTPWWEPAVLEGEVQLLEGRSFFVRYGDLVGRAAVFLFTLLLAAALFRRR